MAAMESRLGRAKGGKLIRRVYSCLGKDMIPCLQDARDAKGWILEGLDPYHCQEGLDKGTERSEIELAL